MKQILNLAVISFHAVLGEKEHNLKRIKEYIQVAKYRGADMVLLPEMSLTGYEYCENGEKEILQNAESISGQAVSEIADITRHESIYAIFGMPEKKEDQYYQTMVVCGPEGYLYSYRKMFLQGKECFWAQNGKKQGFFDTPWGKVGIGINPDIEQENLITDNYSQEVRLCLYPGAISNRKKDMAKSKSIIDNIVEKAGVFVAFANLAGKEKIDIHAGGSAFLLGDLTAVIYGGGSVIAGPGMHNKTHVFAGNYENGETGIIMATIDLSHAKLPYNQIQIAEMRCSYE